MALLRLCRAARMNRQVGGHVEKSHSVVP